MGWDQATTRRSGTDPGQPGERELTALTIACHPDLDRIGDRHLLPELDAGHEVRISRTEPSFAAPATVWGRPLEDPFLSRRPLVLRPSDGGILIDRAGSSTELRVGGDEASKVHLSAEEVEAGVVLELAGRIVLVLHRLGEPIHEPPPDDEMIGFSAPMAGVRGAIQRVADLEVAVLLRGESGTGKELAARALHRHGRRADGPFVAVNLGALPPSLAAAELFGSVKGAFTGAVAGQQGYFRQAQGGTLFLDEVGETPAEVQAMLLRTLETGEVYPLGSQRPHPVDLRLVAATDADLEARVRSGSFKEPLLHRLSAYEIWLPPLRRRRDDIGRLFVHFARQELAALGGERSVGEPRLQGSDPAASPWLPADLAARLVACRWPGNVRQLRNVVRQLVIDNRGRDQLVAGTRVERLLAEVAEKVPEEPSGVAEEPDVPAPRRRPAEIEPEELEAALRAHRFEPTTAARALGITRPSLYYLIRQHPTLKTAEDLDAETVRQALDACDGNVAAAARQLEVSARALRRRLKKIINQT